MKTDGYVMYETPGYNQGPEIRRFGRTEESRIIYGKYQSDERMESVKIIPQWTIVEKL